MGGTGAFRDRPAAQLGAGSEAGISTQLAPGAVSLSPAAGGSILSIEQSVTNEGALAASAQRQSRKRAGEREQLTLKLFEDALDVRSLTLVGFYLSRFDYLYLGLPFVRYFRFFALKLGVDGIAEPVVEVSDAA